MLMGVETKYASRICVKAGVEKCTKKKKNKVNSDFPFSFLSKVLICLKTLLYFDRQSQSCSQ